MAKPLQKLELTWVGKGEEPQLEPRILIEDTSKSFGDPQSENILIHGDNLLALKALEQDYAGRIKCIYIDPPYNTNNAFKHYDDGIEHSLWLNLISQRLNILHRLLSKDGALFVNIDENEHAYLKVVIDEIFGRSNFLGDLIWKKRKGGGNDSRFFAIDHDYVLVYAKDASKETHKKKWRVSQSEEYLKRYKEIDENGNRYYWDTLARDGLQNPIVVTIDCPDGTSITINSQKSEDTIKLGLISGDIRLTKVKKGGWSLHHRVYMPEGQVLRSILDDIGTNKESGEESEYLFGRGNTFDYPKPESLIKKLIELTTSEGDIVLDSFLGSGTTAAVAHKMNRRWIGIELGEHAVTHCLPRLKKVVMGEDKGGITHAVNWKGGGGFKFYTLAPSLIKKDKYGNEIINPEYNATMLAAAMARQEGFRYSPVEGQYWKQGFSSEKDYIFTTTQFVTLQMIDRLADELKPGESLLVCCKSFAKGCENRHNNITIKKIPQILLGRCEFGKDDYSLNIVNIPHDNEEEEYDAGHHSINEEPKPLKTKGSGKSASTRRKGTDDSQSTLFN